MGVLDGAGEAVRAGVQAISHERGAVELSAGTDTNHGGELVTQEPDGARRGQNGEISERLRMKKPPGRLD